MKNISKPKEEGLPDVAQKQMKKRPVVLVMSLIAIIIFFSASQYKKSTNPAPKPIEEVYSVQKNVEEIKREPLPTPVPNQSVAEVQQPKEMTEEQVAFIRAKQAELQQRLSAPLMLVNNSVQPNKSDTTAQVNSTSEDRNTQFLNQVSSQNSEIATATTIGPLNTVIAEGSFIHAILEPATNSDLPGYVRAVVSEASYSEDGTQILIPQGSRLIGQYKSEMLQGQSRVFMVWTRLITPTGISIQLGSPGVDSLGIAGMGADEIDRHFWERFGTATLLSMVGAGAANVGVSGADQDNSSAAYRTAMANSFAKSANQSLRQDSKIPPTLKNYQGKPIMVFVAHDLSFQAVMKQTKLKTRIF